jgi:diacylglycerol kinase family enzyme
MGVMILKTLNYGGYFVFARDAARDSGCFHVVLFSRGTLPSLLRYAVCGLVRRVEALDDVTHVRARSVRIESAVPAAVEMDGDYFAATPVTVTIQPRILPVIVPADRPRDPRLPW